MIIAQLMRFPFTYRIIREKTYLNANTESWVWICFPKYCYDSEVHNFSIWTEFSWIQNAYFLASKIVTTGFPNREDICLQTLLLLFKYANHKNKISFVSTANEALVGTIMTIGDVNNIFPIKFDASTPSRSEPAVAPKSLQSRFKVVLNQVWFGTWVERRLERA